jgi:kynurenine formamidase
MCAPYVMESVQKRINRRNLIQAAGAVTAAATTGCLTSDQPPEKVSASSGNPRSINPISYSRVIDLTHTLNKDFPAWFVGEQELTSRAGRTFVPPPVIDVKPMFEWEHEKVNLNQITYWEHVGTHMDAPAHFSEGDTVEKIPAEDLILNLAVIDIKSKAANDPLALMTLEDLKAWESRNGPIPDRALVAMNSGWASNLNTPKFKSLDANGKHRQPAMHIEAIQFLMEERKVIAIGVDTFSFDNQHSPEFDVHYTWLGDNRWGIENMNNLDDVPPVGATVIVGQPKIEKGTGGPNRVLALV